MLAIGLGVLLLSAATYFALTAAGVLGVSDRSVRNRLRADRIVDTPTVNVLQTNEDGYGIGRYLVPAGMITKIEANVAMAGRPANWSAQRIVKVKAWGLLGGGFMAIMIIREIGSPIGVLFGLAFLGFCYFAPDLLIKNAATKRQTLIQYELPDVLDQVTISVEAGLGFDAAIARAGETGKGALAEEVVRTVQDVRLGMSRREAYLALAARCDVDDLRKFTKSIVQAEEFGVPISNIVRSQASDMRMRRRQRAEQTAGKLPVKILIPLMTCILPVLFIVVLAPPLMDSFG